MKKQYKCVKCGEQIKDGEGHLQITYKDFWEHEQAEERYTKATTPDYSDMENMPEGFDKDVQREFRRISAGVLTGEKTLMIPRLICWHEVHIKCEPDGELYAIPVEQIRTHRDVIGWTAHLFEKDWFCKTNWGFFLYEFLKETK